MKKEKCKIFCIYFKQEFSIFSSVFNTKAENLLREIAKIGGTDNYFNSNSLESLCDTFDRISDAIQTSYKLKLK